MPSLKYIPDQIMWHDGMLLSPQHFQQAFKRCENIIRYHNYESSPYHFGIKTFKIDQTAFASGLFKIEELECIFQDGLEYYYNSIYDSVQAQIDLSKYKDILENKTLTLYLSIPRIQNKNSILNNTYSRYKVANVDNIAFDENTGEDEIPIPRVRPNISLLFEHELTPHYISLPLFKIYHENSIYKTREFSHPSTKINRESPVWKICHSICMTLRYKIQDIIETLQKFSMMKENTELLDRIETLKCMKSSLPRLEACIHSEQLHPFILYLETYSVVSNILSNEIYEMPAPLIEYNHYDNLSCFQKLRAILNEYLEKEIPTDFTISKAVKIDNKYSIHVHKGNLGVNDSTHFLLGFKKNSDISQINFLSWIKSAIICDEENFEVILERRVLGMHRTLIEKYENLIPQKNIYLVRVKFEAAVKEKISIIIAPSINENSDFSPDEILLYSRKKS
ncbi:type VI secretion system baseplate subunit TssK [Fluviispira sanaruensis]|uniref:Type VI secretion system baseplate subunit TssK n=1 Tax=Fluviispira sanaruensis TaxID=2493639 RepID=A0A4P2VL59_FLUSA|nr:type VI secretion system baseplate subunit TssK [Fluviispira sanaruensis]BBH52470.1 hypothetical protein JCM31447_09110 [Fluviispira sanaruensis]